MPNKELADLKKQIAKLTGRAPVSTDPKYLRQRLADLEAKVAAGASVRHRNVGSVVTSISLPAAGHRAMERILEREKIGGSELMRRALAYWASENGYVPEAIAIGATDV